MKKKIFNSLGIMSGTSMDGVDLSLISSDGHNEFIPILNDYIEFSDKLQKNLINLRKKISNSKDLLVHNLELNQVEKEFTLFIGNTIIKALKNFKGEIDLLGFHGQTIFHNQRLKITKQLGDGKLLSQILKMKVVNDFRQEDLLNGGQGAPLTPIFHLLISKLLKKNYNISEPINIINIGGITNITHIANFNNFDGEDSIAFDIAPGNCLIDEWVRKNSKKKIDTNGDLARSGKLDQLIFNQALDNFELLNYNKSLDVKDFDISFAKGLSLEDGCSTLTKFTAKLISNGIKYVNNLNKTSKANNIVCGGGRKNKFLIETINNDFIEEENKLKDIDIYELDGDFIESQAFGYLAIRTFLNLPISFPNTTGCKLPTVGGKIIKNF